MGAWNVKREGYFGTFAPIPDDEPRHYGGFYTQDDIRTLVKYAQDRFVNILPEVDVPGHSMAAIVHILIFPVHRVQKNTRLISGEKFMDWPGPVAMQDNTLCPANEKVYTFLDTVFTEIAALVSLPLYPCRRGRMCKEFLGKKRCRSNN